MSVETSGSRPSGQAPATAALIGSYLGNQETGLIATTNPTSSEMVLHMLDTLVNAHEPFYADYPSYQETETLSHPQHQQHQPPHSIPRSTVMPPVSLDATTHTPGTARTMFILFYFFLVH